MLVGFDAAEDIYLVDGALLQLFVLSKTSDGDDLDRVLLFIRVVDGSVDLPIDPRPDDLIQRIILNVLHHTSVTATQSAPYNLYYTNNFYSFKL